MELPKEDYMPVVDGIPADFSMIVFGPPKVGKTTFGAEWPKSLLLECEQGGAQYLRCRKLDIPNLTALRDAYKAIKENGNIYETIIIDSLDKVAEWVEAEICAEMGLTTIMDTKKGERHGAQWAEYKARVLGFLAGWRRLGKRIILLAHVKRAETDTLGNVVNPRTVNLYGQCAAQVLALIDNVGYMYAREDAPGKEPMRLMSFCPGAYVEAGARHPKLANRLIELPKGTMYQAFAECFEPEQKDAPKAAAKEKELAKAGGRKK